MLNNMNIRKIVSFIIGFLTGAKTSDKRIKNESIRRKALISYGRGPEGEEVYIEKNEFNRITPIFWSLIFPVIAFILFYYDMDIIKTSLKERECFMNPFSFLFIMGLGSILAIFVNWFVQLMMFLLLNSWNYKSLCIRYNKKSTSMRLDYKEPMKLWKFRTVYITAHILSAYLPLVIGFIMKDMAIYFASALAATFFFDETYILWRLRRYSGQTLCSYKSDEE